MPSQKRIQSHAAIKRTLILPKWVAAHMNSSSMCVPRIHLAAQPTDPVSPEGCAVEDNKLADWPRISCHFSLDSCLQGTSCSWSAWERSWRICPRDCASVCLLVLRSIRQALLQVVQRTRISKLALGTSARLHNRSLQYNLLLSVQRALCI